VFRAGKPEATGDTPPGTPVQVSATVVHVQVSATVVQNDADLIVAPFSWIDCVAPRYQAEDPTFRELIREPPPVPTNTELIASVAQRRRETGGRNERVSSNASSILSNAYHDTCQLARAWLKWAL